MTTTQGIRAEGFKGGVIKSEDVQIGMLVRVSQLHRKLDYRGLTGVVQQRYGNVHYAAFDIQFLDGHAELFWHYEFDKAQVVHS